ncbi:MAG: hypothetical protein ACK4Z0_09555 [Sphingomonadaceae bacterium]
MALALGTTGCVTAIKEREVLGAMRDLGFTEADARCLAARAGRQLSVRQLRSLQRAAGELEQPVREMPVGQVIDAIRTHVDGETLGVIVGLSLECARLRMEERAS